MRAARGVAALAIAALLLTLGSAAARAGDTGFISIILDDLGHNLERGKRAIALPADITVSVLPYAEHAERLARLADESGREVMLHMPMANVSGKEIGPGGLTADLTRDDFVRLVDAAFERVPEARGMNNHMGSLLTTRATEMSWLMEQVKARGLYFIDSRTTHETVAQLIAGEHSVATGRRDVFLDNEQTVEAIEKAFERLIRKAYEQGTAIGIAHPHRATLEVLEAKLPELHERGIRIVPVSHTIALRQVLAQRPSPNIATD